MYTIEFLRPFGIQLRDLSLSLRETIILALGNRFCLLASMDISDST